MSYVTIRSSQEKVESKKNQRFISELKKSIESQFEHKNKLLENVTNCLH